MTGGSRYGEVALGMESALPATSCSSAPRNRAREFIKWLFAALMRRT